MLLLSHKSIRFLADFRAHLKSSKAKLINRGKFTALKLWLQSLRVITVAFIAAFVIFIKK